MAKIVFRQGEVVISKQKVMLSPPMSATGAVSVMEPEGENPNEAVEAYEGPTADDLRREAEAFKAEWAKEKEAMINAAKTEAERIIHDAEAAAFQEVKRRTDQIDADKRTAEEEAASVVAEARREADELLAEAKRGAETERKANEKRGYDTGREEGFAEGRAEAERLVERLHVVLERAQAKRTEILVETERQLVDLVLLIARKVVKVISENQRSIVISNVIQALRKVKGRGNVIIRVNLDDLKLTTEHVKDFIRIIEGVKEVTVQEDSTVDRGGCIIETEYGEIDARIASQLAELEQKIMELSPIVSKPRPEAAAPDEA